MGDNLAPRLHAPALWQVRVTAFSVYGYDRLANQSVLAFAGEHYEQASSSYMLGQGYRSYSPVLMRFRSADSWSPLGRGGTNAYAYCTGDPVNRADPSGHVDMTGLLRKRINFPTPTRRGGAMIRALATQAQPAVTPPRPPDTASPTLTAHQRTLNFIQDATQRLQPASSPSPTQAVATPLASTERVSAVIARRTEGHVRLQAVINETAELMNASGRGGSPALHASNIRQTANPLDNR